MSFTKKAAAATMTTAVIATPFFVGATAEADPVSGSCSGGVVNFDTSPIGLISSPTTAQVNGNFGGCQGTPAPGGTIRATFTGTGSCLDVNGQVDGTVAWSDGKVSTVSGPFDVPGGVGAPKTNTLAITSGPGAGGQLVVNQGAVDGVPMLGPCLAGGARQASLPINSLTFS
ncbi:hypothetical protein [Nocardia sp. NPDC052566]|uniref:hypothetical protein n=1 Tax=Nocardia sp. NPDC052566 TaxID=3364330 RepID=UPI0037CC1752